MPSQNQFNQPNDLDNTRQGRKFSRWIKYIFLLISIFIVLVVVSLAYRYTECRQAGGQAQFKLKSFNCAVPYKPSIPGGDRDEHGCIGSAGYSWCGAKSKCLRVWEEKCE